MRTFKIKASISGKNGPVSIVPPDPGSSACVAVQLGVDGTSGDRYSVQFGPESNKITNKDGTLFKVTKPVNQVVCPSGPTTTTTSTSSTTTTTAHHHDVHDSDDDVVHVDDHDVHHDNDVLHDELQGNVPCSQVLTMF
jgi:hypothetical protein